MAREQRSTQKKKTVVHTLPLTRRNYQILGIALLCIAAGYVALVQEPWDGFMPLIIAPVLLVIGYCVLVPLAILYRKKGETQPSPEALPSPEKEQEVHS